MSLEDMMSNPSSHSSSSKLKTASKKLSVAKLRWKMLSKALSEGPPCAHNKPANGSLRRFSSFGLIVINDKKSEDIDHKASETLLNERKSSSSKSAPGDDKVKWFHCTSPVDTTLCLEIKLLTEKIPMKELFQGLDNTGNICVWPSEEVLAYYCVKNKELCRKKVVCELGGGMTCLAGILVGASCESKEVLLTDGNERCIANVKDIVNRNSQRFGETLVNCRRLRWGNDDDIREYENYFDVILCSDCLYFDDGRKPLADTIRHMLKDNGVAVILAPLRGNTFQEFVELSKTTFDIEQVMVYDTTVWELHEKLLGSLNPHDYNPELHYPRMIVLRKKAMST